MSISSLLGLAERLFNGVDNSSAASQTPRHHHHQDRQQGLSNQQVQDSGGGDRFTPSATNGNNATDNVIALQFERLRFSSFNITATPDATPTATGGTIPATSAAAATPATNTAAQATAAATQAANAAAATPAAAHTTAAPVQVATTGTSTTSSAQDLLQTLNAQLAALGLSPAEVQAFDEAAKLIQQFSPAAYQDLVNQLQALAGQFANQASTPATTSTGATVGAAPTTVNATPGFKLTELSLRFTGVNETVQSSGQGGAGTGATTQISAYKLQLQEVQVSLNSPTGQTVQLQAPQTATAKSQATTAG